MSEQQDHFELAGKCMPWSDTSKWVKGEWYPMPVGFFERSQEEYIIDGYMIFEQDVEEPEDMAPVDSCTTCMTFSTALKICEEHNRRKMIE